MKRVKKPKKPKANRPPSTRRERVEIVKQTNYLNLAIMIRTLKTVFDFEADDLNLFIDSYLALMEDVSDGRRTVAQEINDTKEITGIDTRKAFEHVIEETRC